jgi:hypothetical protein
MCDAPDLFTIALILSQRGTVPEEVSLTVAMCVPI